MTGLPAQRLGWKDRGTLREGAFADLVLFNPATVIDRSTFAKPFEIATGIEKVFVSGTLVWSDAKATGAKPGRVISSDTADKARRPQGRQVRVGSRRCFRVSTTAPNSPLHSYSRITYYLGPVLTGSLYPQGQPQKDTP